MSITADDQILSKQLANRDSEATAALYHRFAPIVFSVFLRMTRDRSVAEDLVQELFVRIWNGAHGFNPDRGTLAVWIVSIARNMGIDYIRSAHVRFKHKLQPMEAADQVIHGGHGAEALIDQGRAVEAAFARLNEKQKRVLELAYFGGFSQTEIADPLHEPLGTVKSWTRSALQVCGRPPMEAQ